VIFGLCCYEDSSVQRLLQFRVKDDSELVEQLGPAFSLEKW